MTIQEMGLINRWLWKVSQAINIANPSAYYESIRTNNRFRTNDEWEMMQLIDFEALFNSWIFFIVFSTFVFIIEITGQSFYCHLYRMTIEKIMNYIIAKL